MVVLPDPVAPLIRSVFFAATARIRAGMMRSRFSRSKSSMRAGLVFPTRIETKGPPVEMGGKTACTRSPVPRATSATGVMSSMCRPPCSIRERASSVAWSRERMRPITGYAPSPESTKTCPFPTTKMSLTRGSSTNSASGPNTARRARGIAVFDSRGHNRGVDSGIPSGLQSAHSPAAIPPQLRTNPVRCALSAVLDLSAPWVIGRRACAPGKKQ